MAWRPAWASIFTKRRVYFDHASATRPLKQAMTAMRAAENMVGNPGALHAEAVAAKKILEESRAAIARELACKSHEVVFTSGLTEAINLAILGIAKDRVATAANAHPGAGAGARTHWIVSSIEHAAVLECFADIERRGGEVTFLDPDERGIFLPHTVAQAIRPETVLLSIGWANNEIGVVQPIRDISRAIREINPGILFHSDAGQAPLYLSPHVHTLGVDLLSLGSNKLYGPHGIGALFVKSGTKIEPLILGGGHERGVRSGTENVALAAGFAAACIEISKERISEGRRLRELRDACARELAAVIPGIIFNTDVSHSLPHLLNLSIPGIDSEYITLWLDQKGIAISTKSACSEGAGISHVVAALDGEREWRSRATLRLSLGRDTTVADVHTVTKALIDAVRAYQNML